MIVNKTNYIISLIILLFLCRFVNFCHAATYTDTYTDQSKVKIGDLYYLSDKENLYATATYKLFANNSYYSMLKNIVIPEFVQYSDDRYQVVAVGKSAFNWLKSLNSLILPPSLKQIGINACCESGLYSIELGEKCEDIGYGSFEFCPNLNDVVIGKSVTVIGHESFYQRNLNSFVCRASTVLRTIRRAMILTGLPGHLHHPRKNRK